MPNIIRIRNLEKETNLSGITFPIDNQIYTSNAKRVDIYDLKEYILSGYTSGTGTAGSSGTSGTDGSDGVSGTSGITPCLTLNSNQIKIIITASSTTTTTTTVATTTTTTTTEPITTTTTTTEPTTTTTTTTEPTTTTTTTTEPTTTTTTTTIYYYLVTRRSCPSCDNDLPLELWSYNNLSTGHYNIGYGTYDYEITSTGGAGGGGEFPSYSPSSSCFETCGPTTTTTTSSSTTTTSTTSNCNEVLLGYNNSTPSSACEAVQNSYRIDTSDFTTATNLYSNSICTTLANPGYYSNGSVYRYWTGGSFAGGAISCPSTTTTTTSSSTTTTTTSSTTTTTTTGAFSVDSTSTPLYSNTTTATNCGGSWINNPGFEIDSIGVLWAALPHAADLDISDLADSSVVSLTDASYSWSTLSMTGLTETVGYKVRSYVHAPSTAPYYFYGPHITYYHNNL